MLEIQNKRQMMARFSDRILICEFEHVLLVVKKLFCFVFNITVTIYLKIFK